MAPRIGLLVSKLQTKKLRYFWTRLLCLVTGRCSCQTARQHETHRFGRLVASLGPQLGASLPEAQVVRPATRVEG